MSHRYIEDTREVLSSAFNGLTDGYFKVIEAMHVMLIAHRDQWRKQNRVMYALHPFRVFWFAVRILDIRNPAMLCAYLLHDVVEDSGISIEEIREQFGDVVANIVAELTREPCEDRAEKQRQLLEKAAVMSNAARIGKSLDRIDNLADAYVNFGDKKVWHYTRESIELYHALKAGIQNGVWKEEAQRSLECLRTTINQMIEFCFEKRKIAEFGEFEPIP